MLTNQEPVQLQNCNKLQDWETFVPKIHIVKHQIMLKKLYLIDLVKQRYVNCGDLVQNLSL